MTSKRNRRSARASKATSRTATTHDRLAKGAGDVLDWRTPWMMAKFQTPWYRGVALVVVPVVLVLATLLVSSVVAGSPAWLARSISSPAGRLAIAAFLVVVAANTLLRRRRIPEAPVERDAWIWRMGQLQVLLRMVGATLLAIAAWSFAPHAPMVSSGVTLYAVCFVLYNALVLAVFLRPSLFLSTWLTETGAVLVSLAIGSLACVAVSLLLGHTHLDSRVPALTVGALVMLWLLVVRRRGNAGMNIFRQAVLETIHPMRITEALRSEDQRLCDIQKAQSVKVRADQSLTPSQHAELARLYVNEHKSYQPHRAITVVLGLGWAILVFLPNAISQKLVQESPLYYAVKLWICRIGPWLCG
jgi:hypothetical protein